MKMLFKVTGFIFIITVCTAFGFLKSFSLKSRLENLKEIKNGLLKLKEQLRLHSGDKKRLLSSCFSSPPENFSAINKADKTLWHDFLRDFGKGDTKQEYDRCTAFISLFSNEISKAETDYNEQQKLYKSLGFLSGVFICIFFL